MLVSIITVCFNSENTIQDTLESVINQTAFPKIEYIIIDGSSTDSTMSIINKYKQKISKVVSEPDKGIYDAMNKGIQLSTGDVIGILNSDDIYSNNNVIDSIINHFENDSNLDILYGDLHYVSQFNTNRVVRKWISKDYYSNFFDDGNVPPHPTLFIRRKVYGEIGLFDLHFRLASDYDFMFRLFKCNKYKSKYISEVLVKMRLGGATNKSLLNVIKGNIEIKRVWKSKGEPPPFFLFGKKTIKRLLQFL